MGYAGRRYGYWFKHPGELFDHLWDELVFFLHRGRHGWATSDWWDYHSYIARISIEMFDEWLSRGPMGHPAELTEEKWLEIMAQIRDGFDAALKLMDLAYEKEEYDALMQEYNEGMDLYKKWFFALWD